MTEPLLRAPLSPAAGGERIRVDASPVDNLLNAFALLGPPEKAPGVDPWVARATAVLSEEEQDRHAALFWGIGLGALAGALPADEAPRELPAWLDALEASDASRFRAHVLGHLADGLYWRLLDEAEDPAAAADLADLQDPAARRRVLEARFLGTLPPDALAETDDLLSAPPEALLAAVVAHLRMLWDTVGAREWARVASLVEASAAELAAVDLRDRPLFPALERLTGRDLRGILSADALRGCARIRLIPSAHNGPYLLWFGDGDALRISFGLRPAGEAGGEDAGSALARAVLLRRLEALADDTRLAILVALRDEGPLETAEILERFELSRSAASRHLRQLVANGLIEESRQQGPAKRYALRPEALRSLARSVEGLAGGS